MDKLKRNLMVAQGMIILRPQYDQRTNSWKISKYSRNGGWCRFGGNWYPTHDDAARKIDAIVEQFPKLYSRED